MMIEKSLANINSCMCERKEDRPITVVLADVKTGRATLTYEQRRIKRGIEKGLVKFKTIRV